MNFNFGDPSADPVDHVCIVFQKKCAFVASFPIIESFSNGSSGSSDLFGIQLCRSLPEVFCRFRSKCSVDLAQNHPEGA